MVRAREKAKKGPASRIFGGELLGREGGRTAHLLFKCWGDLPAGDVFRRCDARDTHGGQNPTDGKVRRAGFWASVADLPGSRRGNFPAPGEKNPWDFSEIFAGNFGLSPATFIRNQEQNSGAARLRFPGFARFNFRFRSLSISGFAHFQYPVLFIFNIRFCSFSISGFAHFEYPVLLICNIRFCQFAISGFVIFQYPVLSFFNIRFCHFSILGFAHFGYPVLTF